VGYAADMAELESEQRASEASSPLMSVVEDMESACMGGELMLRDWTGFGTGPRVAARQGWVCGVAPRCGLSLEWGLNLWANVGDMDGFGTW
jgi:hypothetical protein